MRVAIINYIVYGHVHSMEFEPPFQLQGFDLQEEAAFHMAEQFPEATADNELSIISVQWKETQ